MSRHWTQKIRLDKILKPFRPFGSWYLKASPRMMTCREFNDFIIEYVEGGLSARQLKIFRRHMSVCPMCRNYMRTYLVAVEAGQNLLPDTDEILPTEVPADLISAIIEVAEDGEM